MMIFLLAVLAGVAAVLQTSGGGGDSADGESNDFVGDLVTVPNDPWKRFDNLFYQYGFNYGVDWMWLKAIALNESDLGRAPSVARGLISPTDIEASKSSDGKSWGLMQVTLSTAKTLDPFATQEKLNNPEYSVKLSSQLIANLKTQFATIDARYLEWVIKSYNQGPGNTKKEIIGVIPGYAQTYWERFQRNLQRVKDSL